MLYVLHTIFLQQRKRKENVFQIVINLKKFSKIFTTRNMCISRPIQFKVVQGLTVFPFNTK